LRVFGAASAADLVGGLTRIAGCRASGQNAGGDDCGRDRVDDPVASLIEDIEGADFNERRLP
jgi:hypothetical protein